MKLRQSLCVPTHDPHALAVPAMLAMPARLHSWLQPVIPRSKNRPERLSKSPNQRGSVEDRRFLREKLIFTANLQASGKFLIPDYKL